MNTLTILRYCVGIDVAKDTLAVCMSSLLSDQSVKLIATHTWPNSAKGFDQLQTWMLARRKSQAPLRLVMEATGVYYEALAYFLHQGGYATTVILPNQAKAFAKSLGQRSKDDQVDARMLAQLGLERHLKDWQPASAQMSHIKQLCRERYQLQDEQTRLKNQLHALHYRYEAQASIGQRLADRLAMLAQQLGQIEQELADLLAADPLLAARIQKVCSLQGVGWLTALIIVAETNGFALFESKAQLVCYAGYDVVRQQSGSSLNKAGRLSKKGNPRIRKALYFPAITSVRYGGEFQDLYQRVLERSRIKMKALVAVQRKLLVLIYSLFKTNQSYQVDYQKIRQNQLGCPA